MMCNLSILFLECSHNIPHAYILADVDFLLESNGSKLLVTLHSNEPSNATMSHYVIPVNINFNHETPEYV